MLVEGRLPEVGSQRGHKEGPHCPSSQAAQPAIPHQPNHHECSDSSFLCERANKLRRHMSLLSENVVPMRIDIFLCPECPCGQQRARTTNICSLGSPNDLLLEQWTVSIVNNKSSNENSIVVNDRGLLQAIRSQLHFSQLSSWYSLGKVKPVSYRLSHPGAGQEVQFSRPPNVHNFPLAPFNQSSFIKVSLKSLPRMDSMPLVNCPMHSNPSPLSTTFTVFKTVCAELGQCLLDPPARLPPVKAGFTAWRESKKSSPVRPRRSTEVPSVRLVDDRMQNWCQHIGKHHCEDDSDGVNGHIPKNITREYHPPMIDTSTSQPISSSPPVKQNTTGENEESTAKVNNDLNKSRAHSVFEVLRSDTSSESESKAELLLNAILRTTNNPLKRKRQQLEIRTKKLLSPDIVFRTRNCVSGVSGSDIDLVDSFSKLDLGSVTKDKPEEKEIPRVQRLQPKCFSHLKIQTPPPVPIRKNVWTDSSSEETESESPGVSGTCDKGELRVPAARALRPSPFQPLLGNFEENLLKERLRPVRIVEGFTADLGASGAFCPKHLVLPVTVKFYSFNCSTSSPYLGVAKLRKKGYTVPRNGTIQVTLLNPLGTVIKMFVVPYDLAEMPPSSHTFVRQRTVSLGNSVQTTANGSTSNLRYLIHIRFSSSKSGRIFLDSDIKMIISRQYDLDSSLELDMESSDPQSKSFTVCPSNPRFSPLK